MHSPSDGFLVIMIRENHIVVFLLLFSAQTRADCWKTSIVEISVAGNLWTGGNMYKVSDAPLMSGIWGLAFKHDSFTCVV